MPDQPSDTKKTARKIAMGAALGGALGVAAALRNRSPSPQTVERPPRTGRWDDSAEEATILRSTAPDQSLAPRTLPTTDHPDWQPLPAAHLPRPTYWPVVLAIAIVFLAWGIVTTIAISLIGVALLALALGGWIGELRHGD